MHKNDAILLLEYNRWANQRVLAAAKCLTAEEWTAPAPTSHGSVRGTLAHILGAEWVWRMRIQEGISPSGMPYENDYATFDSLAARMIEESEALLAFVNALPDGELNQVIRYARTSGEPYETPLWQILAHVVNHGTQFRSEASVILSQLSHSPGDLDFIYFVRSRQG